MAFKREKMINFSASLKKKISSASTEILIKLNLWLIEKDVMEDMPEKVKDYI